MLLFFWFFEVSGLFEQAYLLYVLLNTINGLLCLSVQ